jgi:hypothetical protein
MPGYGFSGKPTTTGWGPDRIARAWVVLMKRLGCTKFVAPSGAVTSCRLESRLAQLGNHVSCDALKNRELLWARLVDDELVDPGLAVPANDLFERGYG